MDARTFLTEFNRMCNMYEDCTSCPAKHTALAWVCRDRDAGFDPILMIRLLEKWILEHPKKTRLMDLLEKYPNTQTDGEGFPYFYPAFLGYCDKDADCGKCEHFTVKSTQQCWKMPVE